MLLWHGLRSCQEAWRSRLLVTFLETAALLYMPDCALHSQRMFSALALNRGQS